MTEAAQAIQCFRHQLLFQPHFLHRRQHRGAAHGGVLAQFFNGAGADFPARRVDDAQKRGIVGRVNDQPQVAHDVFDFVAAKKRLPAAELVRHLIGLQLHFNGARLVIAAVQHGKITITAAIAQAAFNDFGGDALGFHFVVATFQNFDRIAVAHVRPEFLFKLVRVVINHPVGGVQNQAGGAVILLQLHHF